MARVTTSTVRKKTAAGKHFDKIVKQLKEQPHVNIGVLSSDNPAAAPDLSMADLGSIHEFGSSDGRVPERSHIRANDKIHAAKYKQVRKELKHKMFFKGMSVAQALGILGESVRNDIRLLIRARIPPPNEPSTIDAKGSSTPLIDTGRYINSLNYEVKK